MTVWALQIKTANDGKNLLLIKKMIVNAKHW